MNRKYAIQMFFSEEDEGYIAVVPEPPGCSAFGTTEEESLEQVRAAMDLWPESAGDEGRPVPFPPGKRLLQSLIAQLEKSGVAKA